MIVKKNITENLPDISTREELEEILLNWDVVSVEFKGLHIERKKVGAWDEYFNIDSLILGDIVAYKKTTEEVLNFIFSEN